MQTHTAKRIEIIIEAPMERRLRAVLDDTEATGYTVLPVHGGSGRSGPWSREGQISSAGGMIAVVCIVSPERVDALLEAVYAVVERQIGVVSIGECEVIRKDRF